MTNFILKNTKISNTLFRNSKIKVVIYQSISVLSTIILGKLIAINIKPEVFGRYNIQFGVLTFFASILISPYANYLKNKNVRINFVGNGLNWFLILVVLTFVFFVILSSLLKMNLSSMHYALILGYVLSFGLVNILLDYLLIIGRLNSHSNITLFKSLANLIIFIYFTSSSFVNNDNILWLTYLLGNLSVFVLCGKIYFKAEDVSTSNRKASFNELKKYAFPLMFLALWSWLSNYFDRIAIEYFLGYDKVGKYSAGYSIGSRVFLSITPIFVVLLSPMVYSNNSLNTVKSKINEYMLYYLTLGILVLAFMYFFNDSIGMLFLAKDYSDGFRIIFWIGLSYFFLSITHVYEMLLYAKSRTKLVLYANVISAIINISLNLILIPKFGFYGSAYATCLGFLFQLLYTMRCFQRI